MWRILEKVMGFIWDILKDLTKSAVNIHALGVADAPIFQHEENKVRAKGPVHLTPASNPATINPSEDDFRRLLVKAKSACAATCGWVAHYRDGQRLSEFEMSLSFCVFCMLLEWSIAPAGRQQSDFWKNSDDKCKIANAVFFGAIADCPDAVSELQRLVPSFDPSAEQAMARGCLREQDRAHWNHSLTRATLLGAKALAGSIAVRLGMRTPLAGEDYSFADVVLSVPFPLLLRGCGLWVMEHLSEPCVAFLIGIQMP
jgi:hypothetical protein